MYSPETSNSQHLWTRLTIMPDQPWTISPDFWSLYCKSKSWQSFSLSHHHLGFNFTQCVCVYYTYIIQTHFTHMHLHVSVNSMSSRWRDPLAAAQNARWHGRTQSTSWKTKKSQFPSLSFFHCLMQRFCSHFTLPKSSPSPKIHCSIIKQNVYQRSRWALLQKLLWISQIWISNCCC